MVNGKMYNVAPRPDNLNIGNTFMWENNTHTVKGFVTDGSKTYIWTNSGSDNLYELNDFIYFIAVYFANCIQQDMVKGAATNADFSVKVQIDCGVVHQAGFIYQEGIVVIDCL